MQGDRRRLEKLMKRNRVRLAFGEGIAETRQFLRMTALSELAADHRTAPSLARVRDLKSSTTHASPLANISMRSLARPAFGPSAV